MRTVNWSKVTKEGSHSL